MNFEPDPDLELIREGIQAICQKFDDDYWSERDARHEFPWDFYRALAEGGWIGIAIPEEYGGGGRGLLEASVILQEVAASGAAMNGCSAIHLSIFGMHPLVLHGSEELKRRYLPRVASGDLHVAFGVTEPDAGTETLAIRTKAVREGDAYRVRGQKVWTSKAQDADKVLLLVRTTPVEECVKRTDGLTLLMADLRDPAVTITPIRKAGRNAVSSCETVYDDLLVPVTDRVGEEGQGFRYLLDGLNAERILIASEAIGTGQAALRRAVDYARERVVYGRAIGQNQGIAFPLADAHAQLAAAELIARKAGWMLDRRLPCGAEANMAKYLGAEAGFQAADVAMQTHGGFGYAEEYHVVRYWREARLMKIAPLPQQLVLAFLAQHELGLPKSY
ncbi:MAG TPA: acyl-CoA dehydrogenase family protein [Amycolatopsis sp.]|nr:acyl-CoA dehydrogenase family protein [Amycolatopsis sp.]